MISYNELKKGTRIIVEGQPYEVLESFPIKKARGRLIIQTKIKNLITGAVFARNFHQGDTFEEAELSRSEAKFLYSHRGEYVFCKKENTSERFKLKEEQIGEGTMFLKPNQTVEALIFEGNVVNINLPIKIQLKVTESPPGIKGDRAQGGTKQVILETGAKINVPLFVETEDVIEINTQTGEYVRRVE